MSGRTRVIAAGVALVSLLAIPSLFAQSATTPQARPNQAASGTINGVVKDKDGVIPGATVVVMNVATGQKLAPIVTSSAGAYSFPGLPAGVYKVTITMRNYRTVEVEVRLAAGATVTIPTTLELGKREEVVNVIAGGDLVRTETPTVSQTVNADEIQRLPRADRNSLSFLIFLPGATAAGGASGARSSTTIDGVTNTKVLQGGDGFFSMTVPRLDAVEEVTLETYSKFAPNRFHSTLDQPLSTFGADVDTASYSNVRRYLSSGQLPPSDAVRVEEIVNYFRFGYAAPRDGQPIALTTEIGECPWNPSHKLVLIGARAAVPPAREITGRNIVLLIDVSGSMGTPERLPLIKTALGMFVDTLKPDDSLAIVTYAGTSGIALPPTPARQRDTIQRAIAALNAGGSTNGGDGLILAYQIARQAFKKGGVNRVILATDGDFNVGITSQQDLLRLITHERETGVFLSVFGVGSGNLKDATMEMLADRGNGHYAYLDSLQEARRVLIREGEATLDAAAKDVKFQVEFNPAIVSAWRQIGYENRALAAQDFNDDRKDAGEMGAGHTVTVLYEIVPADIDRGADAREFDRPEVDPLKYQPSANIRPAARPAARPVAGAATEWLTVKARYKLPEGTTSDLITKAVRAGGPSQHLALAAAVAEFGLILRHDPRNVERWNALSRRLDRITATGPSAADIDGFKEPVATASSLARIR